MKSLFITFFAVAVLSSCALFDPPGCDSDIECRDPRVCSFGECVDPDDVEPSTGPGNSDDGGLGQCWEPMIDCNCEAVDAYDGQMFPADECQSGYVMVTTQGCSQQCYSATWQAVCAC